MHSDAFGETRPLSVYLPARFRRTRRYPLLIVHDGEDYLRFTGTEGALAFPSLTHWGRSDAGEIEYSDVAGRTITNSRGDLDAKLTSLNPNFAGLFVEFFKEAGVKKGDSIVAINGRPVRSFVDVKVLMLDKLPGNEIEVTVSRKLFFGTEEIDNVRFALATAGR